MSNIGMPRSVLFALYVFGAVVFPVSENRGPQTAPA